MTPGPTSGRAPAYWPWSQLLRALFADGADGAGDGGGFGPRSGPGQLRVLLGDAPAPEVSVGARFRLFDAVAEAFAEASRRRPIVVVIEDLHWADEASVRLLGGRPHTGRPNLTPSQVTPSNRKWPRHGRAR